MEVIQYWEICQNLVQGSICQNLVQRSYITSCAVNSGSLVYTLQSNKMKWSYVENMSMSNVKISTKLRFVCIIKRYLQFE